MNRVALCGSMFSGKSTLAAELEKRGYLYVNFTRTLKEHLAVALRALGQKVTVEDIEHNKPMYRQLLQELSGVIGFNQDPKYVVRALEYAGWLMRPPLSPAVFDNVRTAAQFETLERYGFKLVKLELPLDEQLRRAERVGVTEENYFEMMSHSIERSVPDSLVTAYLDATKSVEELAEEVIAHGRLPEVQHQPA